MASISLSVLVFILISVLVDCTNIIVRQLPKTIYFPDKVKVSVDCSASIPQQNNVIFLVFLNDNVVDTSNPSDLVYPEQTTHGDLQTWTISITKDDSLNYQILKCKIMTIDSSMFEILDETSGTIVVIYQTPVVMPTPKEIPGIPEETAGTPEETAGTPEETAQIPEETAGTPKETPQIPEGTPEETPGTPEETPGTPEETPGTPEETDSLVAIIICAVVIIPTLVIICIAVVLIVLWLISKKQRQGQGQIQPPIKIQEIPLQQDGQQVHVSPDKATEMVGTSSTISESTSKSNKRDDDSFSDVNRSIRSTPAPSRTNGSTSETSETLCSQYSCSDSASTLSIFRGSGESHKVDDSQSGNPTLQFDIHDNMNDSKIATNIN